MPRWGGRLKDGETNVASGAAVLAKAARRSGTRRRWGSWGRAAGWQLESFLQTFRGHHPIPSAQKITSAPSPRRSSERRRGKWGRAQLPLRGSGLKSPRESNMIHTREEKNQYHRAGGGGAVPEGNVWQRRASFPHLSPDRDSCFLTRIGHRHPGSPPLRRAPRGAALPLQTSSGLGLPWVRSSTKFLSSGS